MTTTAAKLERVWREAAADTGRIADYFEDRHLPREVPAVLRFHPQLPYQAGEVAVGRFPCMVARMEDAAGNMVCVHRTYLSPAGAGKLDLGGLPEKKLMPAASEGATRGAAIRLDPAGSVLGITEGIETALAVRAATGERTWAAGSSGGMEAVQLPADVEYVHLWADHDEAGEKAAAKAAARLRAEGRVVYVHRPPGRGRLDWLDVFAKHGAEPLLEELGKREPWEPGGEAGEGRRLEILTARELLTMTPERPDFIAEPLVVRGGISDLVAGPKVGKTTLGLALAAAVVDGLPFLGKPTSRTGVLYLTEERGPSFRAALERVGIHGDGLSIVLRQAGAGWKWPEVVAAATTEALERGAGLLIIDSLADWAALAGDSENSSGAVLEALRPIQAAAAAGLAVLLVRHDRKGPAAELGEAGRGSNATAGACDILMGLRKTLGAGHENRRKLDYLARFDGLPPSQIIEWRPQDRTFVLLGTEDDIELKETRERLLTTLPGADEDGATIAEILAGISDEEHKAKRSTTQNALSDLVAAGHVSRTGEGKRGRPFRYQKGGGRLVLV